VFFSEQSVDDIGMRGRLNASLHITPASF